MMMVMSERRVKEDSTGLSRHNSTAGQDLLYLYINIEDRRYFVAKSKFYKFSSAADAAAGFAFRAQPASIFFPFLIPPCLFHGPAAPSSPYGWQKYLAAKRAHACRAALQTCDIVLEEAGFHQASGGINCSSRMFLSDFQLLFLRRCLVTSYAVSFSLFSLHTDGNLPLTPSHFLISGFF